MSRPTSIKLDDEMKSRVEYIAEAQRRSPHWVMREAIRQYVEREEQHVKFKQEALQAWNEYQETSLHLTANEVEGWLQTWGTDQESDHPKCHK